MFFPEFMELISMFPTTLDLRALYECKNGKLTIYHASAGLKRPGEMPSSKSPVGKNVLLEFEQVAQENLDEVMAKIESQRRRLQDRRRKTVRRQTHPSPRAIPFFGINSMIVRLAAWAGAHY
jgi:hypothetical protein